MISIRGSRLTQPSNYSAIFAAFVAVDSSSTSSRISSCSLSYWYWHEGWRQCYLYHQSLLSVDIIHCYIVSVSLIVRGSRLVVSTGYSVHDHSCVTVTSRNFVHNSYSIINFVSSHAHMHIIYHVVIGSDRRMTSHYRIIIIVGKLVGSRGDVIHTHHSFLSHLSRHRAVSRIML